MRKVLELFHIFATRPMAKLRELRHQIDPFYEEWSNHMYKLQGDINYKGLNYIVPYLIACHTLYKQIASIEILIMNFRETNSTGRWNKVIAYLEDLYVHIIAAERLRVSLMKDPTQQITSDTVFIPATRNFNIRLSVREALLSSERDDEQPLMYLNGLAYDLLKPSCKGILRSLKEISRMLDGKEVETKEILKHAMMEET